MRALRDRESHTFEVSESRESVQNGVLPICVRHFSPSLSKVRFYSDLTLQKPLTRVDLQRYIIITTRTGLCTFFSERVASRRFMMLYLFREVNLQGGIFFFFFVLLYRHLIVSYTLV